MRSPLNKYNDFLNTSKISYNTVFTVHISPAWTEDFLVFFLNL